jgi:hypothetical protein
VLRRRFQRPKYYAHFVRLVRLLIICLQFEITDAEIEALRVGFIHWVQEYEQWVFVSFVSSDMHIIVMARIYYQHKPERLSTCPLTIHALLHIADSIKAIGPVWCYWAFPMERFCGSLQPAIRSRRYPYASLDRYITESSQLRQIANLYDIASVLALHPPPEPIVRGAFSHVHCTSVNSINQAIPQAINRSIVYSPTPKFRNSAHRQSNDRHSQCTGYTIQYQHQISSIAPGQSPH